MWPTSTCTQCVSNSSSTVRALSQHTHAHAQHTQHTPHCHLTPAFLPITPTPSPTSHPCPPTTDCAAYPLSLQIIQVHSKSSAFQKFIRECAADPRTRGLDLASFLIKPIQRICKYVLLLCFVYSKWGEWGEEGGEEDVCKRSLLVGCITTCSLRPLPSHRPVSPYSHRCMTAVYKGIHFSSPISSSMSPTGETHAASTIAYRPSKRRYVQMVPMARNPWQPPWQATMTASNGR